MGVLMIFVVGISNLVIREISLTQSVVDSNKAFYAAEAAVEDALLTMSMNPPGYEPKDEEGAELPDYYSELSLKDSGFDYQYDISNQTDMIPYFPEDQPIYVSILAGERCVISNALDPFAIPYSKQSLYGKRPECTYRRLGLSETHIITLHSYGKNGEVVDVNDFNVQYFVPYFKNKLELEDSSLLSNLKVSDFDILRWKLYGNPEGDNGKTESISDFYPVSERADELNPFCIGSDVGLKKEPLELGRCTAPAIKINENGANPTVSGARECYMADAGKVVTGGVEIKGIEENGPGFECSMATFMSSHNNNYLVLTNMVNPQLVGIQDPLRQPFKLRNADIYYRVIAKEDMVKDFAEIKANGNARGGQVVKSLDVKYKAPSFLPVFNFSLYKTKSG